MSYKVYTTEAIVCGSFDNNTADKSYLLFTKDAGLIYASARSVREERSLQRYALQDFSHIRVSLIKGKTGWRIGSVMGTHNYFSATASRAARGSVVRVVKLVRRYIQGEEPHPELFTELMTGLGLVGQEDIPNRLLLEEVITARLLHALGYINHSSALDLVFSGTLREAMTSVPGGLLLDLQQANTAASQASQL